MARQKKTKPKPNHQSNDRLCNDWLEFLFLVCASIGVGGGLFALIYLAHVSGAI
jgi:hypothetical protein